MSTLATGKIKVMDWKEKAYAKLDGGAKLSKASVRQSFKGDLKGEATTEYLMAYGPDGKSAKFSGLQQFTGSLGGKRGSFVLQVVGTFKGGIARGKWTVLAGTVTGKLEGMKGRGSFEAPMGPDASYELKYTLPDKG